MSTLHLGQTLTSEPLALVECKPDSWLKETADEALRVARGYLWALAMSQVWLGCHSA